MIVEQDRVSGVESDTGLIVFIQHQSAQCGVGGMDRFDPVGRHIEGGAGARMKPKAHNFTVLVQDQHFRPGALVESFFLHYPVKCLRLRRQQFERRSIERFKFVGEVETVDQ